MNAAVPGRRHADAGRTGACRRPVGMAVGLGYKRGWLFPAMESAAGTPLAHTSHSTAASTAARMDG